MFIKIIYRRCVRDFWRFAGLCAVIIGLFLPVFSYAQEDYRALAQFANPAQIWNNKIEAQIEAAYRQCFRSFIIDGKVMNLRMPFAENHERDSLVDGGWDFMGQGKADAASLWPLITDALESDDFAQYTKVLSDGREKVIIFDIPERKWVVSDDLFDIARMKAGSYHGLPHKPYALVSGAGVEQTDVYNYLYCVAWTGMDCSAFVWHTLSSLARSANIDLGKRLGRALGAPRGSNPSIYAGTAFYNSASREISPVKDQIKNLRPADIILFRAKDGSMAHSVLIQSVDFSRGVIRYLQETDEAPQMERGVHESFIYFNPKQTHLSLRDSSLVWSQKRHSPFPGEKDSAFSDDGRRYRAYGGGRVVRLNVISSITGTR